MIMNDNDTLKDATIMNTKDEILNKLKDVYFQINSAHKLLLNSIYTLEDTCFDCTYIAFLQVAQSYKKLKKATDNLKLIEDTLNLLNIK